MTNLVNDETAKPKQGPKYLIDIEGTDYPWERSTITVAEIRDLGHLDPSQPVIEVNLKDNSERTLAENDSVELKLGIGFARKVRFKRG